MTFQSFEELSIKLLLFFSYLFIQRAEDLVKILQENKQIGVF